MNPFEEHIKKPVAGALTGEQYAAKLQAELAEDKRIRNSVAVKPSGQRPKCKCCGRELRLYRYRHPDQPTKLYGKYGDNRFCGLTCGYRFALWHTRGKENR